MPPPSTRSNSPMPLDSALGAARPRRRRPAARVLLAAPEAAHARWLAARRRRDPRRALRPASSRRRTPRSGPSTSAPARRTPGRRTRSSGAFIGFGSLGFVSAYPRTPRSNRACRCGRGSPRDGADRRAPSRARRCCHVSSPCSPRITTSSPGATSSRPVTSTVIMSIDTAPTIGTRRPRISTDAAAAQPRVEAVGIARRHDGDRARRVRAEAPCRSRRLRRAAGPSPPTTRLVSDITGRERQRRRERRRHDPVEQQPGPHGVEPHARVAQQRGAVAGVTTAPARQASSSTAGARARSARAASSNSALSGTSADAKCVYTASSRRFGLASTGGSVRRRLSWRKPEAVHAGVDLQVVADAPRARGGGLHGAAPPTGVEIVGVSA